MRNGKELFSKESLSAYGFVDDGSFKSSCCLRLSHSLLVDTCSMRLNSKKSSPSLLTRPYISAKLPTLLGNLDVYVATRCSDPRDIVYSLLSISQDRHHFRVDYGHSITSVCIAVVDIYAQRGLLIHILASAMQNPLRRGSSEWPTWLPDWRSPPRGNAQTLSSEGMLNSFGKLHPSLIHEGVTVVFLPPFSTHREHRRAQYRIEKNELIVSGWILPRASERHQNLWLQTLEPLYGRPR